MLAPVRVRPKCRVIMMLPEYITAAISGRLAALDATEEDNQMRTDYRIGLHIAPDAFPHTENEANWEGADRDE
jgi:hypothetical protein